MKQVPFWKKTYLVVRCAILWVLSAMHFFVGGLFLVVLAIFVDPRKTDLVQRIFARNVVRLSGTRLEVRCAPGFDPRRTSIFISNHVNIFDPFVLYSAIPQFIRGWELEDHFRVPVYGWMMKRFGNVPVTKRNSPSDVKRLIRLTQASLDKGISLVVFAEGGRTRDGFVRPFREGIFRMLRQLPYPIVPVSIVGSFRIYRKGGRMLYPGKIVVYIHDTIETQGLGFDKDEVEAFRMKVQQIVSAPVNESNESLGQSGQESPSFSARA